MDIKGLFKTSPTITFKEGETIFSEGSPGDSMFVLLQGEVDLKVNGHTVETLSEGEMLGEMALIDSKPRSATAVARGDCVLAKVDERRFLFMIQQTPFFAINVMRVLVERLRKEIRRHAS